MGMKNSMTASEVRFEIQQDNAVLAGDGICMTPWVWDEGGCDDCSSCNGCKFYQDSLKEER